MKKIKCSNAGLTLLEVMIALSIFAIAGIAGLQSCLVSTRHIQIVNDEKNLVLLSRIKLEELKTGITDTEYGVTFTPYKLTVKTQGGEYSTLTGFLKLDRESEKK